MKPEDLLRPRDVAKRLGMSVPWVYSHANGTRLPLLPSVPMGKSIRFDPADVDKFVEECKKLRQARNGHSTIQ